MNKILYGQILMPGSLKKAEAQEKRVRKGFWKTLKKAASRLPFLNEVIAGYYCALDPRTPARARGILLAALAYFVMPIDLIPDFLAGVGFTDDIAVLTAAFTAIRGNLKERHFLAAKDAINRMEQDGPEPDTKSGSGE